MVEVQFAIITLCSIPPYSLGWLTGLSFRAGAWVGAAFRTGFRKGRYGDSGE